MYILGIYILSVLMIIFLSGTDQERVKTKYHCYSACYEIHNEQSVYTGKLSPLICAKVSLAIRTKFDTM